MILYGPPTSGKDTITDEVTRQDGRFSLLLKLKAGTGRTTGYRLVSYQMLEALDRAGRLVAETHRYRNIYAVDREDVQAIVDRGQIPIVHMGNVADLRSLRDGIPLDWLCVLLWVPREVCAERSANRGDTDTPSRLRAWDETLADLQTVEVDKVFGLTINTDQFNPAQAAKQIITTVSQP